MRSVRHNTLPHAAAAGASPSTSPSTSPATSALSAGQHPSHSANNNNNSTSVGARSTMSAGSMSPSSSLLGPASTSGSGSGIASARETVTLAETHHALRSQLEEYAQQVQKRQNRLEELVVVQAALNSQSNALRRKQISLDPIRSTCQRLASEVKKLERDLDHVNAQLAEPEARQEHYARELEQCEEAYVSRFELRAHLLSDKTVIALGGLASTDLADFNESRRRDAAIAEAQRVEAAKKAEKERRRRYDEDDADASGLEDLLVRCGNRNSAGVAGFQQTLYGGGGGGANDLDEELTRRLPPTSVVPEGFRSQEKPSKFDVDKWAAKHTHLPVVDPRSPTRKQQPTTDVAPEVCPSNASVATQYSVDAPKKLITARKHLRERLRKEVADW